MVLVITSLSLPFHDPQLRGTENSSSLGEANVNRQGALGI